MATTDLSKKNQKFSTSTKNQKIGNTMVSSSMTALAAPTNGLIANYIFDGNSDDSSGNGYHGIPANLNWIIPNAYQATMANFTGSSYITLPS
jgi:hypothetical protein